MPANGWKIPIKGQRVRRAFQMWAAGYGLREIHSETKLFASGNNSSYASMFRNRSYLGIAKFGEEELPDHHPALVDQEIWRKDKPGCLCERIARTAPSNHCARAR